MPVTNFVTVDPLLPGHRKVAHAAKILQTDGFFVWTRVVALWMHAFNYSPDGEITSLVECPTGASAALEIMEPDVQAFFNALVAVGFVDRDDEDRYFLHNWENGAGRLHAKRRAEAERKRGARQDADRKPKDEPKKPKRVSVKPEQIATARDPEAVFAQLGEADPEKPGPCREFARRASEARANGISQTKLHEDLTALLALKQENAEAFDHAMATMLAKEDFNWKQQNLVGFPRAVFKSALETGAHTKRSATRDTAADRIFKEIHAVARTIIADISPTDRRTEASSLDYYRRRHVGMSDEAIACAVAFPWAREVKTDLNSPIELEAFRKRLWDHVREHVKARSTA